MIKAVRYIAITLGIAGVLSMTFPPQVAFANNKPNSDCDSSILTFPAWYNGIVTKNAQDECVIITPTKDAEGASIQTFVIKIILNLTDILMQLVAYTSVVFLIVGGFRYLSSSGLPEKMTKAKKTISNSIYGLIIATLAVAIVNLVGASL